MVSIIEGIYNKFCNGDSLSDDELTIGINHFRPLGDMLFRSGPVFRLAAQEANRVASRFEDYKESRSRK